MTNERELVENLKLTDIGKAFIDDVESVKDYLPKCNSMEFPQTFDEFAKDYGFTDDKEIYTNGSHLIPVFRVKQWLDHIEQPTFDDCVRRQAVIEYIEACGAELGHDLENESVREDILNMPSVIPTQRWIPVSERLPEDRNIVLVTAYWHETYQVMMASYFGEGLWWCVPFNNCGDHMQKLNPKAWQPLPQPYKEKRGKENGSN